MTDQQQAERLLAIQYHKEEMLEHYKEDMPNMAMEHYDMLIELGDKDAMLPVVKPLIDAQLAEFWEEWIDEEIGIADPYTTTPQ